MDLRKPRILRCEGSISKQFNLRVGTAAAIVYADNIESPLARWWKPLQVIARHFRYFPPLVPVYGRLRRFHVARGARLHLDEADHIMIPGNEVNLSVAARRAEVARHDRVAELPQIEVSIFFATRSGAKMGRAFIRSEKKLRERIQSADDRSSDAA
jgi:hypothetical protein